MNSKDEKEFRDSARRIASVAERAANESGWDDEVELALAAQLEVLLRDLPEAQSAERPNQA